ncbi:MAG: isocitrate lyase/phosphoenolpyruvate mutase family protein [Nitrospira sp.]|nr:isocitrate lyase/phosphoenolpyruvate mutase family protein [Nitrospira sp.]
MVPASFDMVSAKVIEQAGFEAVYLSGYGHTASHLGLPDAGLISFAEMVERVHNLARSVNIPVIADGDTGFGNVINVRRTVQEYEWAGAQAIQIEDQEIPKKCGHTAGKRLIDAREMALKVQAAINARRRDDFLIIARTDAITVTGIEDAIRRGKLYEEAGADVIFVESPTTLEELKRAGGSFKVPTMANMVEGGKTPLVSNEELHTFGFKLVAYPVTLLLASITAMKQVLAVLKEKGTTQSLVGKMTSFQELDELIGFPEVRAWEARYSLNRPD